MAVVRKISVGGKEFDVGALTLWQLRRTQKLGNKMLRLQGAETDEEIDELYDTIIEMVFLWIGEEHPEMTKERIEREMTEDDSQRVMQSIEPVMVASGVDPAKGEARGGRRRPAAA